MNSFIIETETGALFVIDGGYYGEGANLIHKLKEISRNEKPFVKGWFLTHAHSDHIDCFKEVIEKYSDSIEIGHIYYHFPSIQFFQRYEPVSVETIRQFYKLLPRFAHLAVFVSEGDSYEMDGVRFDILYTPNPNLSVNAGNNSCMVIRLTWQA